MLSVRVTYNAKSICSAKASQDSEQLPVSNVLLTVLLVCRVAFLRINQLLTLSSCFAYTLRHLMLYGSEIYAHHPYLSF